LLVAGFAEKQNRPRPDARSKQPGRAERHPISPPDSRAGKSCCHVRCKQVSWSVRSGALEGADAGLIEQFDRQRCHLARQSAGVANAVDGVRGFEATEATWRRLQSLC
jgi:hypothetical protein